MRAEHIDSYFCHLSSNLIWGWIKFRVSTFCGDIWESKRGKVIKGPLISFSSIFFSLIFFSLIFFTSIFFLWYFILRYLFLSYFFLRYFFSSIFFFYILFLDIFFIYIFFFYIFLSLFPHFHPKWTQKNIVEAALSQVPFRQALKYIIYKGFKDKLGLQV